MDKVTRKETLFRRIAEGDKKAFDVFFNLYYDKLIQFAKLYVDSVPQAEDVVSDVLTSMLLQRERVFLVGNFDAYLYSSIKNKALSSLRNRRVAEAHAAYLTHDRKDSEIFPDPHNGLVTGELRKVIEGVIARLPPRRKMVFQLVRDEELSYSEVAALLEISVRTVEVHLRLAVAELRKTVEAYLIHDAMDVFDA